MLVVHDGVNMAHTGRPFAPYLSLDVFLSRSIDFREPDGLSWVESHSWVFPCPAWEGGGLPVRGGALVLTPGMR